MPVLQRFLVGSKVSMRFGDHRIQPTVFAARLTKAGQIEYDLRLDGFIPWEGVTESELEAVN
jgi:hypothetical protein